MQFSLAFYYFIHQFIPVILNYVFANTPNNNWENKSLFKMYFYNIRFSLKVQTHCNLWHKCNLIDFYLMIFSAVLVK